MERRGRLRPDLRRAGSTVTTTLSRSQPVARKPHGCGWCGRTIQPGEKYDRASYIWEDGQLYTWAGCLHCLEFIRIIGWHVLDPDAEGVSEDDLNEWEPASLFELRLKALWRKNWARRDGTLYAIPEDTRE